MWAWNTLCTWQLSGLDQHMSTMQYWLAPLVPGNAPQCEEQMTIMKNMMEHVHVLHEWMHIVLFGGE